MLGLARSFRLALVVAVIAIGAGTASAQLPWPFKQTPKAPADRDCLREERLATSGHLILAQAGVKRPRPDQKAFQAMLGNLYPYDLWLKRIGGDVGVSFCISKTGRTFNHKITEPSGYPQLDQATLIGLPYICWEPARDAKGRPVEICRPPYQMMVYWRPPERPPSRPPTVLEAPPHLLRPKPSG